jgi:hypothetical protein
VVLGVPRIPPKRRSAAKHIEAEEMGFELVRWMALVMIPPDIILLLQNRERELRIVSFEYVSL